MNQSEQQETGTKQLTDEEISELVAETLLIKAIKRNQAKEAAAQKNQPAE